MKNVKKFDYIVVRGNPIVMERFQVNIPGLWIATVVSLPKSKRIDSGFCATRKEAVTALIHKLKQAGYSGILRNVGDTTIDKTKADFAPTVETAPEPVKPKRGRKASALNTTSNTATKSFVSKVAKVSRKANGYTIDNPKVENGMVSFGVAVNVDAESKKAWKMLEGAWVAKSQCRFEPIGKAYYVDGGMYRGQAKPMIKAQHGMITVPQWLFDKL